MCNNNRKEAFDFLKENPVFGPRKKYVLVDDNDDENSTFVEDSIETINFIEKLNLTPLFGQNFNLDQLIHLNIDTLKLATDSSFVYIYLVKGNKIYLSSQEGPLDGHIWDIKEESTILAATVAFTMKLLNIKNFKEHNLLLGCHIPDKNSIPTSALLIPLITPLNVCLGVMEFQRKYNQRPYSTKDVEMIVAMTSWIGANVHQRLERDSLEKEANFFKKCDALVLKLIGNVDESDTNNIAMHITNFVKIPVGAEKCMFFKLETKKDAIWSYVEALESNVCCEVKLMYRKNLPTRFSETKGLLALALESKEIINIKDTFDPRFDYDNDRLTSGTRIRNAIILPIWGFKNQMLGIFMAFNKINAGIFNVGDEDFLTKIKPFLAYALEYNTYKEYNDRILLESEELKGILKNQLRPCKHDRIRLKCTSEKKIKILIPKLQDPYWYYVKSDETSLKVHLIQHMITDIISSEVIIKLEVLQNMILVVSKLYRDVPYHNFEHAFNVCHCIYFILKNNEEASFTLVERVGLILGALFLDVDHPGLNNNYFQLIAHPFAVLITDSFLEHRHFFIARILLYHFNFFENLDENSLYEIEIELRSAILFTDLEQFFKMRPLLLQVKNTFRWNKRFHRYLLKGMLMTLACYSGYLKDFHYVKLNTYKLYSEFYNQGDVEKKLGFAPISIMKRKNNHLIPKDQIVFLDVVILPCADLICHFLPNTKPLYEKGLENKTKWSEISLKDVKFISRAISSSRDDRFYSFEKIGTSSTLSKERSSYGSSSSSYFF